MPLRLMLSGVVVHIINEVMITSDDYLMLVWQGIQECDKSVEFTSVAVLGEVASVDEDISFWELADVEIFVEVVGVAHR